jgi:hypothetical protein
LRVAKFIQKAASSLAAFFAIGKGGTLRLNPLTTKGTKVHEVELKQTRVIPYSSSQAALSEIQTNVGFS